MTSMAKRRGRKPTKQPNGNANSDHGDGFPLDNEEEAFNDQEVERQSGAIRALRDVEIEKLLTTLRLLRSYFSKDQSEVPVLQFFEENFPNLLILETGNDGQSEVKWKDKDMNFSMNHPDERTLHTSLLHRLSVAYPDFSAGVTSLGGFEFSDKSVILKSYFCMYMIMASKFLDVFKSSDVCFFFPPLVAVKTCVLGADKLQIRLLVLEEPSDSQILDLKDGLQTPNGSSNRLSVGVTPKTLRHPRCGEMLLSVHGSPLGVFKEDNMETIKETEDG